MIFLAALWHAQTLRDRSATWQRITGPVPALVSRMEYDPAMKMWEVLLEGGWMPLRDGDQITLDSAGVIRVEFPE